jgi:hypothetical protein
MEIAARSRVASVVTLVGAGFIAISPVTLLLPNVEVPAVALTAVDDPLTAWEDVLQTASANATTLYDQWAADPFPVLHQVGENLTGYIDNFPTDAGEIATQIADNLQAAFTAAFDAGTTGPLYGIIESALPSLADYQSLYEFAASPVSGVLLGEVGTVLGPVLALKDSYQDFVSDLSGATPDTTAAVNDLLNIPANIADAYLNGQFLDGTSPEIDLSSLVSALGTAPYYSVDAELPLGGLLSTNAGSFFNALDLDVSYMPPCMPPICMSFESFQAGEAIGPIAALEALSQDVAQAITPTGTADSLPDLATLLSGDLSTALANLPTEFSTLTTDLVNSVTSLF